MFGGSRRSSRCEPPKVRAIRLDHFAVRRRCCFTSHKHASAAIPVPENAAYPTSFPGESQGREVLGVCAATRA